MTMQTAAAVKRLLTQATFGPKPADVANLINTRAADWVDTQLAMPYTAYHTARWLATDEALKLANPNASAGADDVTSGIYHQALMAPDQLRQRVAFALSQILVVSTALLSGPRAEMVASYYDLLAQHALGNFRALLEGVCKHPAMGVYLSHLGNQPADAATGRQPDQNFARELMQLFSIGLLRLNAGGTPMMAADGPLPAYTQDDVAGLAAVFTGWSWSGPDTSNGRFTGGGADPLLRDPARNRTPMQAYPQFHSKAEKRFLGHVIAADANSDAAADLATALDALFNHPNVGPFIGRQLIKRLVTSNPSGAYVARVAAVFDDNGQGVRGDLRAVVRALLLDIEARILPPRGGTTYGKLREPVLRITAWLRAFGATTDSGAVLASSTDDASQLGQTPARSSSVFNFYRPEHIPAGGPADAAGMALPEMQITSETSTAGYVNFLTVVLNSGMGPRGLDGSAGRSDLQPDYTPEMAVIDDAAAVVDLICAKLLIQPPSSGLRAELLAMANIQTVPLLLPDGSNQMTRNTRARRRITTIALAAMVSPEFVVQK